jgi:hypothetical protein
MLDLGFEARGFGPDSTRLDSTRGMTLGVGVDDFSSWSFNQLGGRMVDRVEKGAKEMKTPE